MWKARYLRPGSPTLEEDKCPSQTTVVASSKKMILRDSSLPDHLRWLGGFHPMILPARDSTLTHLRIPEPRKRNCKSVSFRPRPFPRRIRSRTSSVFHPRRRSGRISCNFSDHGRNPLSGSHRCWKVHRSSAAVQALFLVWTLGEVVSSMSEKYSGSLPSLPTSRKSNLPENSCQLLPRSHPRAADFRSLNLPAKLDS